MIKEIISYLYHKYVCKPININNIDKEDFIKVCENFYKLNKNKTSKTFEEYEKTFRKAFSEVSNDKIFEDFLTNMEFEPKVKAPQVERSNFNKFLIKSGGI